MFGSRESMLRKLHARDEYYRRRARQSIAEFLRYTKPDYQLGWFHEELAGELDQFLDDVLQKRSPRLIVAEGLTAGAGRIDRKPS